MLFVLGVTVPHDMGATAESHHQEDQAGPKREIERRTHCATFSTGTFGASQTVVQGLARADIAATNKAASVLHL
jgi:hypothetical protein